MKPKIFIISDYYGKEVPGGAYKSLRILVNKLLENAILSIKILACEVKMSKKKESLNYLFKYIYISYSKSSRKNYSIMIRFD